MKQKAFAPMVILSALACICIPAPLWEPVSVPGGHLSSHLPQGSLLVDTGPLTSPDNQQHLLTKCIPPCGQASGAWPDLSTPENTSLASKPRSWDCSSLSLPLEQEFCLQEQPLPPVEQRAVTNRKSPDCYCPCKHIRKISTVCPLETDTGQVAPPPLGSLTSQRHLQTVTSAAKTEQDTKKKQGRKDFTKLLPCQHTTQRTGVKLDSPEHLTHTHLPVFLLAQFGILSPFIFTQVYIINRINNYYRRLVGRRIFSSFHMAISSKN